MTGVVECPDWDPDPNSRRGICFFRDGEGSCLHLPEHAYDPDSIWQIVSVEDADAVDLGGAWKARRLEVLRSGSREEILRDMRQRVGPSKRVLFSVECTGDGESMMAGDHGVIWSGRQSSAVTGRWGVAIVGVKSSAECGDYGYAYASSWGTAKTGFSGCSLAGGFGHSETGHFGYASSGFRGRSVAGDHGLAVVDGCGGGWAETGKGGYSSSNAGGSSSTGPGGTACVGWGGKARAGLGGVLLFRRLDLSLAAFEVDGLIVKADHWYSFDGNALVSAQGDK
jgi:hypothetical protein